MDPQQADEVARARLAYVSAGRPPLGAPRRAAAEPPPDSPPPPRAPTPPPDALGPPRRLTRQHVLVVAVLLLCAVGVAVAALSRSEATEIPVPSATPEVSVAAATPSPPPQMRIHVAGHVATPGVVTLPPGSIVLDAIEAAGGLAPSADPDQLNLAAPVSDGMQILIGSEDQPRGDVRAPGTGSEAGDAAGPGVDLNRATADDLEELPGIGPVTAEAIIAWREENGPFTVVEELQEVSGIGPKTFEKLQPLVRVG
ncbi:hypothetical protein TESS_TESS_01764 [Tessaracoccus sp. O5.2]|uniref:helix-hairpin-helix domain-containing protein n=1 Tax=Tessaracoccus sp. O5.2 TaxID=3157622 RepID=UPI0035E979EA